MEIYKLYDELVASSSLVLMDYIDNHVPLATTTNITFAIILIIIDIIEGICIEQKNPDFCDSEY